MRIGFKVDGHMYNNNNNNNNNDNNEIIIIIVQYVGDTDLFARDYYPQHAITS